MIESFVAIDWPEIDIPRGNSLINYTGERRVVGNSLKAGGRRVNRSEGETAVSRCITDSKSRRNVDRNRLGVQLKY